jgi:hypothetical protein
MQMSIHRKIGTILKFAPSWLLLKKKRPSPINLEISCAEMGTTPKNEKKTDGKETKPLLNKAPKQRLKKGLGRQGAQNPCKG